MIERNDDPSDRELRQFAAIWLPLACAVVAAAVYSWTRSGTIAAIVLAVGALLGAVGFVRIAFARPIFLVWIYAAYPIGWVISHLLMAAIFYLVITPIGIVMRIVGYDPLQRRMDRSAKTYWQAVQQTEDKSRYFQQF